MRIIENTRTWDAVFGTKVIDESSFEIMVCGKTAIFTVEEIESDTEEYAVVVDTILPYNPVIKIERVAGEYIVTCFFDDKFTENNIDPGLPHKENKVGKRPDVEEYKSMALDVLKKKYEIVYRETDDVFLMYQKRSSAGILQSKDKIVYQEAQQRYRDVTIAYENYKNEVGTWTDREQAKSGYRNIKNVVL